MPVREFSTKLSTDLGDDLEPFPAVQLIDDRVTLARLEIDELNVFLTIIGRRASENASMRLATSGQPAELGGAEP